MKKIIVSSAVAALPALLLFGFAQNASDAVHAMYAADTIAWTDAPPTLPKGAKAALLEGDPKQAGFFALQLKLPAGYRIPAHYHPVQERITVLKGTFQLGMGDKFDAAALKQYPAGSYLTMPSGMRHFAMAKKETIIQLTTLGPWGITYVDPADDPRNQKAAK